jgi:hypothetical protein
MTFLRTLLRIYEKKFNSKELEKKSFLAARAALSLQGSCFWGITLGLKIVF